jgi:hypothetical protein
MDGSRRESSLPIGKEMRLAISAKVVIDRASFNLDQRVHRSIRVVPSNGLNVPSEQNVAHSGALFGCAAASGKGILPAP